MIKSKIETKSKTEDLNKLLKQIKGAMDSYVTVGVHADAADYPNGQKLYEVAAWNEFGTKDIPARPFINPIKYGKLGIINKIRVEVIKQIIAGTMTVEKALESMGFQIMVLVQNRIKSSVPPPNALSTQRAKALKGSLPKTLKGAKVGLNVQLLRSHTLIDTGHLLRNIVYRVFKKND